jgi:cyclopropane-fatty-acyl-phospholipid synthase
VDRASRIVDAVVDGGRVPDPVMQAAIRFLLRRRLARERRGGSAAVEARRAAVLDQWSSGPVAVETDVANDQHYEVPTELYELMLGPHLKYSSCLWDGDPTEADPDGLGEAEAAMLALTCQRADLHDGQRVLELGCGWGSLTLWMAARMPASEILAVSNSSTQRRHIQDQAAARGLGNVTVVTADVNDFGVKTSTADLVAPGFDRVVSVEMFEHVRNHVVLLDRIARWLRPDGLAFVHVFCHRDLTYPFDPGEASAGNGVRSGTDWMTRHFFAGGVMPSFDHFVRLDTDMRVRRSWQVDGRHYAATCRAWRARLDADPERAVAVLGGGPTGRARLHRWRVFTMACEELFAMRGGHEWFVAHHVLAPRDGGGRGPAG